MAAEDDALVSHSSVCLPVDAFLGRIKQITNDAAAELRRDDMAGATPDQQLQVLPQPKLSVPPQCVLLGFVT